jgi:hypothetical protein
MKRTILTLIGLTALAGVAYAILQTTWLLIALVVVGGVLLILGVFFAGVYVARDMMGRGADIALKAQQLNDQWDAAKMAGLAHFGREIVKVKGDALAISGQQYPALPPLGTLDGNFTIAGLDNDEVQ